MNWDDFATAAPELARLALDRFKATELVMIGTLRKNGFPRISPVEWSIWDGEFVTGGMYRSKKCLDLLRDPRCVIHSTTTNKNGEEGDVKLYGRAIPLAQERLAPYWDYIFATTGWRADGPAHIFTIDFESGGYLRFGDGKMRMLTWPGGTWTETAS